MGLTVLQIADRLGNEADAYRFMEQLRWGDGDPTCPHCDNIGASFIQPANGVSRKTRTGANSERRVWRCFTCRKQFSVITGTVFHGTKVTLRTWILVIFEMCASKNGVAAREIERKYGVCSRTAWFMMHRIREAMKRDEVVEMFTGTVVADETFIGGKPKNRHQQGRTRPGSNRGRRPEDKTVVLSLVNKDTGEVRSRVIPTVTGESLREAITEQVDLAASHLQTDAQNAYRPLGHEFLSHEWVSHERHEYVRGDVTTNPAEGYFSQLKRSVDGTHHHVSPEHLPRYLAEFDYRYSTRKLSDTARLNALMGQVGGKRLTYKRVAG